MAAEERPGETTHWTASLMVKAVGVSVSSTQRIWQAQAAAHRARRFKLSKDPEFVPKLGKIVGLYVNPRAHAIHSQTSGGESLAGAASPRRLPLHPENPAPGSCRRNVVLPADAAALQRGAIS